MSLAGCAHNLPQTPEPVSVKLIAINDFHGRLTVDPNDTAATVAVKENDAAKRVFAGGAAYLATLVAQLRAQAPHSVFVSAGDNIGAAQSISVLTSEEASIDVLNTMGLELSATGNHEFDAGKDELLRMQYGGCRTNPPPGNQPVWSATRQPLTANLAVPASRIWPLTSLMRQPVKRCSMLPMSKNSARPASDSSASPCRPRRNQHAARRALAFWMKPTPSTGTPQR
ncbi:hypothetical protein [Neopusillimonas aromaticivorans]|uniref:hypothetical protein n=1 Tax=Neopusillimonas aromaticivorans TaxID=2979868 RepID=UPI00259815EA|nr:hypothetical protein [Neopusillimonas aromaticivorans]WJJ93555.1 hypothetical protein N7E01_16865 [Neopusillimonas aromaticivorans]